MFYSHKIKNTFQKLLLSDFFQKIIHHVDNSIGAILMLHRIDHINRSRVQCNEHIKISPEYLEFLILQLKNKGFSFVSIDELHNVLIHKKNYKKLIVFTLDDGYQDNFVNGLPIFKKYSVPFVVYITTMMIEKKFIYWWNLLDDLISQNDTIVLNDKSKYICKSRRSKERTFMAIREKIIKIHPIKLETFLRQLFSEYKIDLYRYNDNLPLSWEQIKLLKNEPLVTIGSHTHSHIGMGYYSEKEIKMDIETANNLFIQKVGITPEHFCYPYGNPNSKKETEIIELMNFKTAVTANAGNVYLKHANNLFLLPRFFVTEDSKLDVLDNMTWFKYKNK